MIETVKIGFFLVSFCTYLISGNPIYLKSLFIISILEVFSKIWLDAIEGKLKWKRTCRIACTKLWYVAVIIVGTQVGYILFEIKKIPPVLVTNSVVLWFVCVDITKLLKNLKKFGVDIPEILLKMVKKILEHINVKG